MTMPHSAAAVVALDPIPAPRPTFAALAARIAADPALPAPRRRSIPAYVRALCRHLKLDPATTPADLAPLAERIAAFRPRRAGIGKGHWRNILGGVRWALRYAGLRCPPKRSGTPPSPAWAALLARVEARDHELFRLRRFARWCTERGTAPEDVDQAVAEAFGAERQASGVSEQRAERYSRELARAWNKAAATVPGWPPARLVPGPHPTRWTPSFAELTPSLHADLDAHLDWLGRFDPLAEHAPRRPLKPGAVQARCYELRAYLGGLREAGYALADLRRLRDLVEPETVRAGLRRLLLRSRGGDTRRTYKVACALLIIARDDLRLDADHVAVPAGFCRKLQPRDEGMTPKVRARLSVFDDERNVAALLQLREPLMRDARAAEPDDRAAARLAQLAVALEILLFAPLRIGNLAALYLERHLSFDRAGTARPKCPQALSKEIIEGIRARTGLDVNPHLLRHVAAKLFLERHPGAYEVLRVMLGHKHLATTMRIYAGTEIKAAARHFDAVILDLRHGDGRVPPPAAAVTAMARPCPPERRRLPLARWPAADRAAWAAARRPGGPLDAPGPAAHWRPATVRHVEAAYGHWLGFLAATARLDAVLAPAARVTRAALAAYVAAVRPPCRASTVLMRVQGLLEAVRVLAPGADWRWLRAVVARLKLAIDDRRPKRPHLRPSAELVAFGRELMVQAEAMAAGRPVRAAGRFRDGLMLALLAARPLRLTSFCALRLGVSLTRAGAGWWLRLGAQETKMALPYEAPVPAALVPALERYLDVHRPRLLAAGGARGRGDAAADHLWLSHYGEPLRPEAVRARVVELTRARFGVALWPHLLHTAAVTALALGHPAQVHAAAALLGHRDPTMAERHYNAATSLEAGRRHAAALRARRRATANGGGRP